MTLSEPEGGTDTKAMGETVSCSGAGETDGSACRLKDGRASSPPDCPDNRSHCARTMGSAKDAQTEGESATHPDASSERRARRGTERDIFITT